MYRVAVTETAISLTVQEPTYASRVRANWRAHRTRLRWVVPVFAILGAGLGWIATQFTHRSDEPGAWTWVLVAALAGGAFGTFTFVFRLLLNAVTPSPVELLYPREIIFYADSLEVARRDGTRVPQRWSWIVRASRTPAGLTLVLMDKPRLEVEVDRLALSPEAWNRFETWLARAGRLPAADDRKQG